MSTYAELGLTYVPTGYENGESIYTSLFGRTEDNTEEQARMAYSFQKSQEVVNRTPTELGITTNSARIPNGASSSFETEKAAARMKGAKKFLTYDTENVGTSFRNQYDASKKKVKSYAPTEISFQESDIVDGRLANSKKAFALGIQMPEDIAKELSEHISRIEAEPSYLFSLNDEVKRSLSDLTLYDNTAGFGKIAIGGNTFKSLTGQSSERKPSMKGSALAETDAITRMRQGLSNLTDTKKMNNPNQIMQAMTTLMEDNPVLGGHNVGVFDQGNMIEWLKGQNDPLAKNLLFQFGKPQLDSLPLARQVLNKAGAALENFQLGTVFDYFNPKKGKGQAHYSAADVAMNTNIFNNLLDADSQTVKKGVAKSLIQNGQTFLATSGLGYYGSSFNRNAGQYDITLVKDKKTGEYVPRRMFQEATFSAGHRYDLIGQYEKVDLNGVEHYAMQMEDVHTQTRKIIYRETPSELAAMFDQNLQAVQASMPETEQERYLKAGNSRRAYEKIFDPKMDYEKDTIADKYAKTKKMLAEYQTEKGKLIAAGHTGSDLQHLAITNTEASLNATQDKAAFYTGYEKIENIANMEGTLTQEMPFWDEVMSAAPAVGANGGKNLRAEQRMQNLFIHNVYDQAIQSSGGSRDGSYGYEGMRRLPTVSAKGEMTYYNVESAQAIKSRLRQTLYKNGSNNSSVMLDFERLLQDMRGTMSASEIEELKKQARHQLTGPNGQISQTFLDEVSEKLYNVNVNNQDVVSSVPGLAIHSATSDGTSQRALYMNNLVSNKNEFFQTVVNSANEKTRQSFNQGMLVGGLEDFDIFRMSEDASKRIKSSQEVGAFLDKQAGASKQLFGFKNKKSSFSHLDHNEAIKKTMQAFEANGMATELTFFKEKGDMVLFFTDKDNRAVLNNMTTMEKMTSDKVKKLTIPLMNTDGTVSINGTRIVNRYKAEFSDYIPNSTPNMKLSSTQDRAFEAAIALSYDIKRDRDTNKLMHKRDSFGSVVDDRIAGYNHKLINGQIAKSYPGDISTEKPYGSGSILKNYNSGRHVDMSDLGDYVLQKEHKGTYEAYDEWRTNANYKGNFLNSTFSGKGVGNVRDKVIFSMDSVFRSVMESQKGIRFSYQGVKPQQMMAGIGVLGETRGYTPFGTYNATERENITKVYNYHKLEEARMREQLQKNGLSSAAIDRRLAPSVTKTGMEALAFSGANEVSSVGMDVLMMDDFSLKNSLDKGRVNIKKDIAKANRELKAMQAKGLSVKQQEELQKRIEKLTRVEKELNSGLLTNYEGQSIVDRELLNSYEIIDDMNVKLKTGQSYERSVLEAISSSAGVNINSTTGKLDFLPEGQTLFKTPMNYDQIQKAGMLNKDGRLTVGSIVEGAIDEQTGEYLESINGSQSYGFNKHSEILGIQNTKEGQSLIVRMRRLGQNGSKLIETNMGLRTTAVGASSEALEYISGQKGIQAIVEEMNPERKQYGGLTAITIQTNAQNIVDNMEDAANGKAKLLPGVAAWAKENSVSVGDMSNLDVQRRALSDAFLPHLKGFGLDKDNVSWFKNTASMVLPDTDTLSVLSDGKGMKELKGFVGAMTESFGFQKNRLRMSMGYHDVSEYETKARYSMREFQLLREKVGTDSEIYNKLLEATQGDRSLSHQKYAKNVMAGFLDWDKMNQPDAIMKEGNVVFDMTGQYAKNGESNFVMKDGVMIVDGTSLKDIPKANGRSFENEIGTMANPMSVQLYDKESGFEKTLGQVLEESNGKAFLKTQGTKNKWFKQDYVPVIGNLPDDGRSELDGSHPRSVQKSFENVFTTSKELNERKTVGTLVEDDAKLVKNKIASLVSRGQNAIQDLHDNMGSYMTSTRQGDFNKATLTVNSQHGFSAVIGSYNPLEQFNGEFKLENGQLATNWTENKAHTGIGEMVTSRDKAHKAILGIEGNILSANNISDAYIAKAKGLGVDEITTEVRRNYILDRIQDGPAKGEKALDVFVPYNRQPSQSVDSIQFLSLKISQDMTDAGDNRMMIGIAAAAGSAADNDGDHGYAMLDLYGGKESKKRLMALQREMRTQNQDFIQRGEETSRKVLNDLTNKVYTREQKGILSERRKLWEGQNGVMEDTSDENWLKALESKERQALSTEVSTEAVNRMQDGILKNQNIIAYSAFQDNLEAKNLFRPRDTIESDALFKTATIQAGKGIGMVDNTVVGGRNLLYYAASTALDNGNIDLPTFKSMLGNYDAQGNILIQKLISAKKVTEEAINYDPTNTTADNMAAAMDYLDRTLGLSSSIKNIQQADVAGVVEALGKNGIINAKNVEDVTAMSEALTSLAYANQATKDLGGMHNPAFDVRSAGKSDSKLLSYLSEQPQSLLGTETVRHMAAKQLEGEQLAAAEEAFTATDRGVGQRFGTLVKTKGQSIEELMNSSKKQIAELADTNFNARATKKSKTSAMVNMLSGVGSAFTDSSATHMGMGFGAAWMIGSAIKGGPTPEGAEAQQEATPVEVNPAALLTSPTARVTPNKGENIRLRVSGSGNVDESTVSGLINQQVAGMTGMQMNMNVNVTDNTQTLDKSFYEQAINQALGF